MNDQPPPHYPHQPPRPTFTASPCEVFIEYADGPIVRGIAMFTYFASDPLTVHLDVWDTLTAQRASSTFLRAELACNMPPEDFHGSAKLHHAGCTRDDRLFNILMKACDLREFVDNTEAVCPSNSFEERSRIANQISEIEQYLGDLS